MLLSQSLGCRREADRPKALTADGLIAARSLVFRFYSDASTEDRPAAPTAKGLKSATDVFGKFSDVAGANRLEADLPEVNLPLWFL